MTPWELIWTGRSQELAYLDDLDPGGCETVSAAR
jgi:hypothetical protein